MIGNVFFFTSATSIQFGAGRSRVTAADFIDLFCDGKTSNENEFINDSI